MRAVPFVWRAAGCPSPVETDGTPILPRARAGRSCAHCGVGDARYRLDQAISDKFTTVRNRSILWPHGGDQLCAGCTWAFKSLLVRCGLMFARVMNHHGPGGIWPVPLRPLPRPATWPASERWPFGKPDPLAALLSPPPVPFVAWLPLYGVNHGGEAHVHRTFGPDGQGGTYRPADPLRKIQAKHALPFAEVARDARCYPLAVDDQCVTVDVALWSRLRGTCEALLGEMRAGGVGATDGKAALRTLEAPVGCPLGLAAPGSWRERVAPLRPHAGARWWGLFVDLLQSPNFTKIERRVG